MEKSFRYRERKRKTETKRGVTKKRRMKLKKTYVAHTARIEQKEERGKVLQGKERCREYREGGGRKAGRILLAKRRHPA